MELSDFSLFNFLINKSNLNLFEFFPLKEKKIWIEVGSGNGDYLIQIAKRYPNDIFIGIEIKNKRILKTIRKIRKNKLNNILLFHGNAEIIIEFFFPQKSIQNFIINFPDPWWKKRHHKRRLLNSNFFKIMLNKLIFGGSIYIATDYKEYAELIEVEGKSISGLILESKDKWIAPDIFSKFERDFLDKNLKIYYLTFTKKNDKN